MTAEEYVDQRLDDQIAWYGSKSERNQRLFRVLRLVEIVAAASIPLLSAYIDPQRPFVTGSVAALGAMVAAIAGILGLFQFEHNWVEYRVTCESLKKEKYLFLTGAEPFDGESVANYHLLVQRVETLISRENAGWAQFVTRLKDDRRGGNPA